MKARIELIAVLLVGAVVAVTACGGDKPAAQKAEPVEEVAGSTAALGPRNPAAALGARGRAEAVYR